MIRLPDRTLEEHLLVSLAAYQAVVDRAGGFERRVAHASSEFSARNTKANRTFEEIKVHLDRMCSGARRCMYCEDSYADEVEHFRPKYFYPELTFAWPNYLFACGHCNVAKSNRFGLFLGNGNVLDLIRKRREPPVQPPPGDPLLIDPRSENPANYLILDIAGVTFAFRPVPETDQHSWERARYTISVLKLNRDALIRGRAEAFQSYVARLRDYTSQRDRGVAKSRLNNLSEALSNMQHPTVWTEMCRQRPDIDLLNELFRRAPEALAWR